MSGEKAGPIRIGRALDQFLERSGLAERIDQASVIPEWADRVGEQIAAVTVPVRISRGTLFVGVRSSAWLMELKLMERQILRRLNAGRSRSKITRIRFLMAEE